MQVKLIWLLNFIMEKRLNLLKKIISFVLLWPRDKYVEWRLSRLNESEKFCFIYKTQYWRGSEKGSKSGAGSNLDATANIRKSLPEFINKYDIRTMLDIPCGDFFWMGSLNLDAIDYTGADIVPEMIQENNKKHTRNGRRFEVRDIINDPLPTCDLIFSRDCLVHFLDGQIHEVIRNVRHSGAKFFATTLYVDVDVNKVSSESDRWRPLNLTLEPFNLPEPFEILDDAWLENPIDTNKKIGVWRIEDLNGSR